MTASQTRSTTKALVGIVLLIVLGAICIQAGRWQLRRAGEREALSAAMAAGRVAPRMILGAEHRQGPDRKHPAAASGHSLNQFTVLLDNRNLQGEPGFWVATPLALTALPHTALLVLRGWVARPVRPAHLPDLQGADGTLTVQGTMLAHVPRIFDLGSITGTYDTALPSTWPAPDGRIPRVQNLALPDLQRATGLTLLPVVLEQDPTRDRGTHPGMARPLAERGPELTTMRDNGSVSRPSPLLQQASWPGAPGVPADLQPLPRTLHTHDASRTLVAFPRPGLCHPVHLPRAHRDGAAGLLRALAGVALQGHDALRAAHRASAPYPHRPGAARRARATL
ncbi:hypothetical protein CDEF62S_02896 [Castellaniella defragrans]